MDKRQYFDYLIETTTHNIDSGTYASYYAFYLHGYNFAHQEKINKENDCQIQEDLKEYSNLVMSGIK